MTKRKISEYQLGMSIGQAINLILQDNTQFSQDFCSEEMRMGKEFLNRAEIVAERLLKCQNVLKNRFKKNPDYEVGQ